MSCTDFTIVLMLFTPVIVAIAIVLAIVVATIKHSVETKHMNEILQKCIDEKGIDFVKKVLGIVRDSGLNHKHMISLLETTCGVKYKKKST